MIRRVFSGASAREYGGRLAFALLSGFKSEAILLADRGHDADWIRALTKAWPRPTSHFGHQAPCGQSKSAGRVSWRGRKPFWRTGALRLA